MEGIYNILTEVWIVSMIGAIVKAFRGDGECKELLITMWIAILSRGIVGITMLI